MPRPASSSTPRARKNVSNARKRLPARRVTLVAAPVTAAEFARCMDCLGPFEPAPHIAVAVSGGRDSLALALLADEWVRVRHGRLLALTVDHGLRPRAAEEAETVARWLLARGIAHKTLVWRGAKPASGVQAAARDARYRLLLGECQSRGILHLLLAHHHDDQIETVLHRIRAGSGTRGQAGMGVVAETPSARLLRPLLSLPRARLDATLRRCGQDWIDDPSNADMRYARARLRRELGADRALADEVRASLRLAARARPAEDVRLAAFFASAAIVLPQGGVLVDGRALAALAESDRREALCRAVQMVSGSPHPPRQRRLAGLVGACRSGVPGRGMTAGGCRVLPVRWQGGRAVSAAGGTWLLVVREAVAPERRARGGSGGDRGMIALGRGGSDQGADIGMLGADGWRRLGRATRAALAGLPAAIRPVLPVVSGFPPGDGVRFRPPRPLGETPFFSEIGAFRADAGGFPLFPGPEVPFSKNRGV